MMYKFTGFTEKANAAMNELPDCDPGPFWYNAPHEPHPFVVQD